MSAADLLVTLGFSAITVGLGVCILAAVTFDRVHPTPRWIGLALGVGILTTTLGTSAVLAGAVAAALNL